MMWILSVKPWKDWFYFALWGGRQYVAAVDLLDENEVFWKIWLAPLGIQILKVRKHEFFNE